jgi:phosphoglycolate phosphatase-like HAD superfamily hydrolase
MIKLIAFDLDGTLTDDKKEITPHTLDALMKIQSQGQMLTGSLAGIGGDSGMGYGGGSDSEIARSRDFEDFDEWE